MIIILVFLLLCLLPARANATSIGNIQDNRGDYTNQAIPKHDKLEITFSISETAATQLHFPYDSNTPGGIRAGTGITVNAIFTNPQGTTYRQPAFYYQDYEYQVINNRDWIYPTNNYSWKVRFSPNLTGNWSYRLEAIDASGTVTSANRSFTVADSQSHGFVRVSPTDSRYFEFEDATYFPGLGYNMNFSNIGWNNPVQENRNNFQIMGQNGIQLIRMWLSQWSIYGSMWNPWRSGSRGSEEDSLTTRIAAPGSDVSMVLEWQRNPGIMLGWMKNTPAVKRNTTYQISIRYLIPAPLQGPRISGYPYGLVARTGGWMNDSLSQLTDPCPLRNPVPSQPACRVITSYATTSPTGANNEPQWSNLTGTITTGSTDYLENLYLTMENVADPDTAHGKFVYIDTVELREVMSGGALGPNIISKPSAAHHLYFDNRYSFAFDKVLELARQYNVYLRPVVLEKNDYISNRIDFEGNTIMDDARCTDSDQSNNPAKCPGNNWFYGNWRETTKIRWLQKAWWRYVQARWGYSQNIHSWELLNEGDPYNGNHYTLTDEFGQYMHCEVFGIPVTDGQKCSYNHPNDHLTNTSFWHSFPISHFWENPSYPNVDFADIHQYIFRDSAITVRVDKPTSGSSIRIAETADFYDSAGETYKLSMQLGAKQPYGVKKPVIRGETGFVQGNTDGYISDFNQDTQGIWLHNFLWGQINPGGLMESNWYDKQHIYPTGRDLRPLFGAFYRFISTIPLNNGRYQDVAATVQPVNPTIRVWGQKDTTQGAAHLWVQNTNHSWKNVIDGVSIPAVSGTVSITGFQPNVSYPVERWDTYTGAIAQNYTVTSSADGTINLSISNLTTDTAFKIGKTQPVSNTGKPGDANGDTKVDGIDYMIWRSHYNQNVTGPQNGDFDNSGKVDGIDYMIWRSNYNK